MEWGQYLSTPSIHLSLPLSKIVAHPIWGHYPQGDWEAVFGAPQGHFVYFPPEIWAQPASKVSPTLWAQHCLGVGWGETRQWGSCLGHHFSAYFLRWAVFTDNQNYSSPFNFTLFPFQKLRGNIEVCWNKASLKLMGIWTVWFASLKSRSAAQRHMVGIGLGDQGIPSSILQRVGMLPGMVLDNRTRALPFHPRIQPPSVTPEAIAMHTHVSVQVGHITMHTPNHSIP